MAQGTPARPRPAQLSGAGCRCWLILLAARSSLFGLQRYLSLASAARQSRLALRAGRDASGPCPARIYVLDLCRGGDPLAAGRHRADSGRRLHVRPVAGTGVTVVAATAGRHIALSRRPHGLCRSAAPARAGPWLRAPAGGLSGRCLQLSVCSCAWCPPFPFFVVNLVPGIARRAAPHLRAGDAHRHHPRAPSSSPPSAPGWASLLDSNSQLSLGHVLSPRS